LVDELPGVVVVVVDDEPAPVVPDGDVVVVLLLPDGDVVVVVPGEAEGGVVRSGVLPTRSVSVRLHAAAVPKSSASAQTPDSILFISMSPPCGVLGHGRGVQRTCP
jgi:hypothetical protein